MLKTGLKITLFLAILWIGLGLMWSMKRSGQEVSYVNIASIIKSYGSLQSSAIGMNTPMNRIILESDVDEVIGKGHGWDISEKKGDTFRVVIANSTSFTLETENGIIVSPFRFDFSVQDGKKLKR